MITGGQLQTAMLRRQISMKDLARRVGTSANQIGKWCLHGVPEKKEDIITSTFLNDLEADLYGAHHRDMSPDTISEEDL